MEGNSLRVPCCLGLPPQNVVFSWFYSRKTHIFLKTELIIVQKINPTTRIQVTMHFMQPDAKLKKCISLTQAR